MRLLALLLVALLAGCSTPVPPTQPTSDASLPLVLESANTPRPLVTDGRLVIAWNFSAEWRPVVPSGDVNVTLAVTWYGWTSAGNDSVTSSFAAGAARFVELDTPFRGPGDYYYELTAKRVANGELVGRKVGIFETCLC
jgi:hypothetical protein